MMVYTCNTIIAGISVIFIGYFVLKKCTVQHQHNEECTDLITMEKRIQVFPNSQKSTQHSLACCDVMKSIHRFLVLL